MSNFETCVSKVVLLKRVGDGGLGAPPPAARRFLVFFWKKKAILLPLDHILHVFRAN